MMTSEEFEEWAKKLNLSEEAKKEIQQIRNSPPSRRVGGGKYNVPGRYSSKKMGETIQFESHKVELPAIYMMEFDENVLEYYDQPPQLKVTYYPSKNRNKKWTYMYTADYFVIEKEKAYWVEWKTEEKLIKLSQEEPEKYSKEEDNWVFAPGQGYAEKLQLDFLVRSSKEISWPLHRNLMFLEDYIVKEFIPESTNISRIKDVILKSPGLTLKNLIENADGYYTSNDVYALIVNNTIYIDIYNCLIAEPENIEVYLNKEQFKSFTIVKDAIKQSKKNNSIVIKNGNKILWGEKPWKILNHDKDSLFLCSDENDHITLPIGIFESYISSGHIKGIDNYDDDIDKLIKERLAQASEEDLKIALQKNEVVARYISGERTEILNVTERTVRNWVKAYKEGEELYGNGYLGLLPNIKNRGNKKAKIPPRSLELMNDLISNSYQTIKMKTAKVVYGELVNICEENNTYIPSYTTFCEAIKKLNVYEIEESRKGKRAAYKYEEFYTELEFTTPKHGERVFEICHIDHTELDIELKINGEETKRPWLTFMIDAFSRRILAFYLSFEEPSYRSCMMVIRECVRKYTRLPNYIVVDGGKEFNSVYFESLLALYRIHKKERPAAKARFGNVVERLFGITNKAFVHNLLGNTQLMKNVRQVTKSVNPKNHAVWTFDSFYERLDSWINEVYDNLENPSTFKTPKEAFEESI